MLKELMANGNCTKKDDVKAFNTDMLLLGLLGVFRGSKASKIAEKSKNSKLVKDLVSKYQIKDTGRKAGSMGTALKPTDASLPRIQTVFCVPIARTLKIRQLKPPCVIQGFPQHLSFFGSAGCVPEGKKDAWKEWCAAASKLYHMADGNIDLDSVWKLTSPADRKTKSENVEA
jgi:hypothetical protein